MNWRGLLRNRHFYAATLGALLLVLALWFNVVWVWGVVLVLFGVAVLSFDWLASLWKGEWVRRILEDPEDPKDPYD